MHQLGCDMHKIPGVVDLGTVRGKALSEFREISAG